MRAVAPRRRRMPGAPRCRGRRRGRGHRRCVAAAGLSGRARAPATRSTCRRRPATASSSSTPAPRSTPTAALVTAGGRVLAVTAVADDFDEAQPRSRAAADARSSSTAGSSAPTSAGAKLRVGDPRSPRVHDGAPAVPELPETETIARDLDARGRAARRSPGSRCHRPDVLREVDAATLRRARRGRGDRARAGAAPSSSCSTSRARRPARRAAALHRRAAARGRARRRSPAERERRFVRVTLRLADGRALHYRDIRALGTVALMAPARFAAYDAGARPRAA